MRYQVIGKASETQHTFDVLREAVKAIQHVGVYPYPGVVEEAMKSRNMPVDITVDEASKDLILIVRRRAHHS